MITQRAAPVTLFPPTLIVSTDDHIMIDHDETGALSISFRLGGTAKVGQLPLEEIILSLFQIHRRII